ncbi:MAG: ABC transporter permease subunit [Bdellovibrionales bacterium]|nr:ABC transporter permease subunit [Bdellovibrionales bacterium]
MKIFLSVIFFFNFLSASYGQELVKIGSKKFTESYILAEIMSQYLESKGFKVKRSFGLAGTLVAYKALQNGEIDIYPEYTGTISQVILKQPFTLQLRQIKEKLKQQDLDVLKPFGFNNTYAVAMKKTTAQKYNLTKISQLKDYSFKILLSYEFLNRQDGWKNLKKIYFLDKLQARAIEHELAYRALYNNEAELMDAYSTDGMIKEFDLVLLDDDKNFFPKYFAIPLVRNQLSEPVKESLLQLANILDNDKMTGLNARVQNENWSYQNVARDFLNRSGLVAKSRLNNVQKWNWQNIFLRTRQHLFLTFTAILMALLLAIPLGILLQRVPKFAEPVIAVSGILQTIPSIALLAFMIPIFGIGTKPAIFGLFLYSILPILRNTYVALTNIPHQYMESARGIGLGPWETLLLIQIPIGLPIIIAGVRTATVINIGTATLAAFIGAGGLGEPIVTGLALNNNGIILQGAIPAACLAILTELLFSGWERKLKSKN